MTRVQSLTHRTQQAAVAVAVLLSGLSCATPIQHIEAPATMPAAFSQAGAEAMPDRWWKAFGDERLNTLVEQALAGNMTLRTAWDRLAAARATARKAGADLYPSLTGSAGATRTRSVSRVVNEEGGVSKTTTDTSDFSLGLVASYEIDLWGRIRSTRHAAELDVLSTEQDLAATAITLAGQVAETWFRIVELRGQLALLDKQGRTNEDYLELVTLRFRRGKVSASDVFSQRQLVESTRAERIQTRSDLGVLEHTLSVLLGRAPGTAVAGQGAKLPMAQALPRTGVPAELVRKRPDVRAAYMQVQAADQRVAAAIADRFPTLSLSVSADTSAEKVRDLFDNWLASLAANVTAPILDGGRRAAEVDRTRAAAAEKLHAYGQAVLDALQEVEDALVREQRQREYLASLTTQLELAAKVLSLTREEYAKGQADYLRVLDALKSRQSLERSYLQGRRELIGFRLSLYRALGGGWDLSPPGEAVAVNDGAQKSASQ